MITVKAPAKVNLNLRILGKREDGYHDLVSLVQKVSLYDKLTFRRRADSALSLTCDNPDLPTDEGNLVWRAADDLRRHCRREDLGVDIHLAKKIPHGAGLGGGSSDAAATLMALDYLWELNLPPETMLTLAAGLGSDVPLFLKPSPAVISGRGEIVTPVTAWLNALFVIVFPGASISTQWVYSNFRLTKHTNNLRILALQEAERGELRPEEWGSLLVNDLEGCVLDAYPEVARCREGLLQWGAVGALMSGSGSAVFGLFHDSDQAETAAQVLSDLEFGQVFLARPVLS